MIATADVHAFCSGDATGCSSFNCPAYVRRHRTYTITARSSVVTSMTITISASASNVRRYVKPRWKKRPNNPAPIVRVIDGESQVMGGRVIPRARSYPPPRYSFYQGEH